MRQRPCGFPGCRWSGTLVPRNPDACLPRSRSHPRRHGWRQPCRGFVGSGYRRALPGHTRYAISVTTVNRRRAEGRQGSGKGKRAQPGVERKWDWCAGVGADAGMGWVAVRAEHIPAVRAEHAPCGRFGGLACAGKGACPPPKPRRTQSAGAGTASLGSTPKPDRRWSETSPPGPVPRIPGGGSGNRPGFLPPDWPGCRP